MCEEVLDHEITINNDENWTNDRRLYSHIRIKSGNTLTVSCHLYLQPGAKIIVERGGRFILDDHAVIANANFCDDSKHLERWKGIRLAGNYNLDYKQEYANENYQMQLNDHGVVLLKNGSVFKDARIGIQCYSNDDKSDSEFWGGYINAEGVRFENNSRSVAFMSTGTKTNLSTFNNCVFTQGNRAITNWASDGVTITNSVFGSLNTANSLNQFGVYSLDANMLIEGNTFLGLPEAIGMDNLLFAPGEFYQINNNTFEGNGGDRPAIRANIASNLSIRNNDFMHNGTSVSLMGQSEAYIEKNDFSNNGVGVDLESTGTSLKQVGCNTFDNNFFGVDIAGNNFGFDYDFNQNGLIEPNVHADLFMSRQQINNAFIANQGSEDDFATNLFSEDVSILIPRPDTTIDYSRNIVTVPNQSVEFIYTTEDDDFSSLIIPRCHINDQLCQLENQSFDFYNYNVIHILGSNPSFDFCDSIGRISTIVVGGIEKPFEGVIISNDEYQQLIIDISESIKSNEISFGPPSGSLEFKHRELIYSKIGQNDVQGIKDYLDAFGDHFIPLKYGLAVKEGDFESANAYLNKIEEYANWEPFVLSQRLYLDFINNIDFMPTEKDSTDLQNYASQDEPLSGFARSALALFYDIHAQPISPTIEQVILARGGQSNSSNEISPSYIYPNPTNSEISVNNINATFKEVKIFDSMGKLVYFGSINNKNAMKIDCSNWNKGIYIAHLEGTNNVKITEKIVIQ